MLIQNISELFFYHQPNVRRKINGFDLAQVTGKKNRKGLIYSAITVYNFPMEKYVFLK